MTDKEMIKLLRLRFRRIGLNSYRAFIIKPDGKAEMYEHILDADGCRDISNIGLDALRAMPKSCRKRRKYRKVTAQIRMKKQMHFALIYASIFRSLASGPQALI